MCNFIPFLGMWAIYQGLLSLPNFVIIYHYEWQIETLLMGIAQIMEFNKKFDLVSGRIFEVIEDEKYQKEKLMILIYKQN